MKRCVMVLFVVALCFAAVSCQKPATSGTGTPAAPAAKALVADAKSGFVIRSGEGLWAIMDGAATWSAGLILGEKLGLTGATQKATPSGGQQRDYVEVKRDSGATGWARQDYVISSCTLSVVSAEDAIVYTEPKNTAATGTMIPRLTVVAAHAEGGADSFVKVTWFNPQTLVLSKGVFVRADALSQKPDDVQSIILLQLAQASTNGTQKQAFLESAKKDYPGSVFITLIEDALAGLTAPAVTVETEKFFATLVSVDDKVNVRSAPDTATGSVVTELSKGQKVEVEEQTKASATIDGQTAPWYRIKEPAGWVFGAFLAPEE
jgi:hypothetical protein